MESEWRDGLSNGYTVLLLDARGKAVPHAALYTAWFRAAEPLTQATLAQLKPKLG